MPVTLHTPLLWADPPGSLLQQLYTEARAAVPYRGCGIGGVIAKQDYLRKVSVEYGERLAAAGIFVEGETDA